MRIIRSADWTEMPWKNGGGITSEILAEKSGDSIVWRLSTAIVDSDCEYSSFPGLVRVSTAIEGEGTILRNPENGAVVNIPPLEPTMLDGNIVWHGTLNNGSIRLFNLIYDPGQVQPLIKVFELNDQMHITDPVDVLFCIAGKFRTNSHDMAKHEMAKHDMALAFSGKILGDAKLLKIQFMKFNRSDRR